MKSIFKLIVLLACFAFVLHAEDPFQESDSLARAASLIPTIINGSVCAITGELVDSQTDLVLPGPAPLVLSRNYSSRDQSSSYLFHSWHLSAPTTLDIHMRESTNREDIRYFTAYHREASGGILKYHNERESHKDIRTTRLNFKPGKGFEVSARTNYKMQEVALHKRGEICEITDPIRGFYHYRRAKKSKVSSDEEDYYYNLIFQKTPCGHRFKYEYNDLELSEIRLMNASELTWFSFLRFNYHPKFEKDKPRIEVTSHDGRWVNYEFKPYCLEHIQKTPRLNRDKNRARSNRYYLESVESSDKPPEKYQYSEMQSAPGLHLCRKELPQQRFVETEYYKKGTNTIVGTTLNLGATDPRLDRVLLQRAPVGADATPIITHQYSYTFYPNGSGWTDVFDAYGNKVAYGYNADHHLTACIKLVGGQFYSQERYTWGAGAEKNYLLGKAVLDPAGNVKSGRFFWYEGKGNVKLEGLYGNLTGHHAETVPLQADGRPLPHAPGCYMRCAQYSHDARNLLIAETAGAKTILYDYLPQTNLLTSKLTLENGLVILRQFHDYDVNGLVTQTIVDNGSTSDRNNLTGITERKLTRIWPRATAPVGVTERLDECYLDLATGEERLIKRIFSAYTAQGRLCKQDHYDSDGVYRYTLAWEYDSHGNVIRETNALGQIITRQYDANDNLIYEQGPSSDFHTEMVYDFSNRLICKKEVHADGSRFVTRYRYDLRSNRIAEINPYGQETLYKHDELNRCTATIAPGNVRTTIQYDYLNNPIAVINANGFCTHRKFNARGQPLEVTHPNGSSEHFEYHLDGTLAKSVQPNGTYICFQRDIFGRVTEETTYSSTHQQLNKKQSLYNAFHLLQETDLNGTTSYTYSGAGQLVETVFEGRKTAFAYDSLNRLVKETTSDATKTLEYDLLGHITKECLLDSAGTLVTCAEYVYDPQGNCLQEISHTQVGISSTKTEYNSQNLPIKRIDPLGKATTITYNHHAVNRLGQRVLQTTQIDPLGNHTVVTYDIHGRIESVKELNSLGILLAEQELTYDLVGNLIQTTDHVIHQGQLQRKILTLREFNAARQLISLQEAAGTSEQKTTTYAFNAYGQKAYTQKPDGVILFQEYDDFGRLAHLYSSDHSCDYTYFYNLQHQPIKIIDQCTQQTTLRFYNNHGELISETLGNGQTIAYAYTSSGEVKAITLPDRSSIEYSYGIFLKKITRLKEGKPVYTHTYHYDLAGTVTQMELPGQAGIIHYEQDLNQRLLSSTAPFWNLSASYNAVDKLTEASGNDSLGIFTNTYAYDDLCHLTSEMGSFSHHYQSDSLHNRLSQDETNYTINALNQHMNGCRYDPNGNLTHYAGQEYRYDVLNRLIAVSGKGYTVTYTYDALHRRLSKTVNGEETLFLYQGQNEIEAFSLCEKFWI